MKRISTILAMIVFSLMLIGWSNTLPAADPMAEWEALAQKADWKTFSKNLVMALNSCNEGLQVSAMQMVVKYADKVNVKKASLKLLCLYRNHKDERVRLLALVTIHATKNEWALGFVCRDLKFEKSPKIKKLMYTIIQNSRGKVKSANGEEIVALAK